jgi:hypothetical protein
MKHLGIGICMLLAGCESAAPTPVAAPARGDAGVRRAPLDAAATDRAAFAVIDAAMVPDAAAVAGPPEEQPCPPPAPAQRAALQRSVNATIAQMDPRRVGPPIEIRPICEEARGWLVEAAWNDRMSWGSAAQTASSMWLAAPGRPAQWLPDTAAGPTYDFDGDGTPEASTIAGIALEIWFRRGTAPSYALLGLDGGPATSLRWARWGTAVVWLGPGSTGALRALGFRPGRAPFEIPDAACALADPATGCERQPPPLPPADPPEQPVIARGPSPSTCAQLDDATRRAMQDVIEQAVLGHQGDPPAVDPPHFQWGCASHGETPVVVSVMLARDHTAHERWRIRGGKAELVRRASSSTPDEWTESNVIQLGDHGDLDGDGFDESILVETWSGHGSWSRFTVRLGGVDRELPSGLIVHAPDGKRDAIVEPPMGSTPPRPGCIADARDGSCMSTPPPRWLPQGYETYDWELHAPQVRVWNGARFVALSPAEVAKVIAQTRAARATMPVR